MEEKNQEVIEEFFNGHKWIKILSIPALEENREKLGHSIGLDEDNRDGEDTGEVSFLKKS